MTDCLFCRIVRKEVPCQAVFEDEAVLAFRDIQPQAPVHVLVIPKKHVARLADLFGPMMQLPERFSGSTTQVAQLGAARQW